MDSPDDALFEVRNEKSSTDLDLLQGQRSLVPSLTYKEGVCSRTGKGRTNRRQKPFFQRSAAQIS